MSDSPWLGDACSLVDAFRAGDRSPAEELEATAAAIDSSKLNAFSHLDLDTARTLAQSADISKPFGGVPTGIKELESVKGWPNTEASLLFKSRIADRTGVMVERLRSDGGVVPVGLTTASEFGGLNVSVTKLNGVTHNPWQHGRTVGGSSSGSAAAVAGGIVPLATGGDGGGSIRIPAGYTGLLGMKGTFGRIPRSPHAFSRPNTVVLGCTARSVRDAARYFDVCGGPDLEDPSALPKHESFEDLLSTHDLKGKTVGVVLDLGGVALEHGVAEHLEHQVTELLAATGMKRVDLTIEIPNFAAHWAMGNMSTLMAEISDQWPGCAGDLTPEIALGVYLSRSLYNIEIAGEAEFRRVRAYEAMANAFRKVDFVVAATNPGPAFDAEARTSNPDPSPVDRFLDGDAGLTALRGVLGLARIGSSISPRLPNKLIEQSVKQDPGLNTMGALTIISNVYGNPAVSIPAGTIRGLPIGLQVLAPHHHDALLFDVALAFERHQPWPLVAPANP